MTVVQSESDQLLKAGIGLLVHRGILGSDVAQLLEETGAAVVIVPFRVLEPLIVVGWGLLDRLEGVALGLAGASALHGLSARDASHPTLASGGLLLLRSLADSGGSVRRARTVRRSIVVDTPHVVKKVPSAGESISGNGTVASFKEAEMRVVSMAMESMSFALVTEEACVGRELQLGIHAGGHLATVWLQVGIQIFTIED
jgi:hypothetical protein